MSPWSGCAPGPKNECMPSSCRIPGSIRRRIVRSANLTLLDHQKIRGISVWPSGDLPRTEGTRKLKRRNIRDWVATGEMPKVAAAHDASVADLVARFAGGRRLSAATTIDELGLSSLERVELMVALEEQFGTHDRRNGIRGARRRWRRSSRSCSRAPAPKPRRRRSRWTSRRGIAPGRRARPPRQPGDLDPAAGAGLRVDPRRRPRAPRRHRRAGRVRRQPSEPLRRAGDPVGAAGALARPIAPAMAKEFFKAHFFPATILRRAVSRTASTTTCRRSSSTPSRCRSAKPARGRRCATSAR